MRLDLDEHQNIRHINPSTYKKKTDDLDLPIVSKKDLSIKKPNRA
jgi:hypothetical protein